MPPDPPSMCVLTHAPLLVQRQYGCTVLSMVGAPQSQVPFTASDIHLVPRLLPRKTGGEPGRSDHVPCDILCVVLIIKLLPTQPVLSIISATYSGPKILPA